jgi:hypothetical protein
MAYNTSLRTLAISGSGNTHVVGAITSKGNTATSGSVTAGTSFIIGSADLNETDLEKLDGITDGAGAANKALVLNGSADIASGLRSITGSGNARFAHVHGLQFYGGGAGLTSVAAATAVTATAVSGTTAELTTGVETSGYLKVTGSSTLVGGIATSTIAATAYSGSSTLHSVGATTMGLSLAVSGTIYAKDKIENTDYSGSGNLTNVGTTTLVGPTLLSSSLTTVADISSSAGITVVAGITTPGSLKVTGSATLAGGITTTDYSGSGKFQIVNSASLGNDLTVSGSVAIGTTISPAAGAYDLHVNGAAVTVVGIDGGSGADAYLRFNTNGAEKAYIKQGSGGNTAITNDVAAKTLNLQARGASGAAYTFLALNGGTEALSSSVAFHNDGAATFSAELSTTGSITAGGNVLPGVDNTLDLGTAALRWRNIYTGDLHLKNDRGDWSVVEEEEYLSVINNKTGKKYKFVLEEIED